MRRAIARTFFALAIAAGSTGCDDCDTEPNVPDPSVRNSSAGIGGVDPSPVAESESEPANEPRAGEAQMQGIPPLEQAMSAPDDAVTSEGRFLELMEQGLAKHIPDKGLVFASGGVDQPTTRLLVTPDATVRWARGDGMYWDELDDTGVVELNEQERQIVADLVERAWTERELDYPPSMADRGEILVLRDSDTARVFEGAQLPQQLLPLRQLLMHATQPPRP